MKLQQFDMVVKYRKGEENGAADYVSRLHKLPNGSYEVRHVYDSQYPYTSKRRKGIAEVTWKGTK